ncbi:MAG TPA: formyltransferase family protein [Syntrophorhabdaceae bacterium]|nr:formyltransferase family protein [Syntrophorhabdaceae bacterium]
MKGKPVFAPIHGILKYACGVSGSGTNYDKIYEADPLKPHIVFSNNPDCSGVFKAKKRNVPVATLDSKIYFKKMWGAERVPRYGVERNSYDMAIMTLVEQELKGEPDLICLAGYDLWIGEWMAKKYFPKILNVHPGDSLKYAGLGWRPTAKAIIAGEKSVKSTVFFVDEGDDTGPILIQSRSIDLSRWDNRLYEIRRFMEKKEIKSLSQFKDMAQQEGNNLYMVLEDISKEIQDVLKEEGDWKIYPFAVHNLIAKGRVYLDDRKVYIDGVEMPENGWQVDLYGYAENIA